VIVGDEIPGKAKITEIQAYKVIFVNLTNNRNEYVDLPEESTPFNPTLVNTSAPNTAKAGVNKLSSTRIVISRAHLDEVLKKLDDTLSKARVVPNPGGGFRIFQIINGSIYQELGLQNNDILAGVNGEPIDASKAFGMLNELNDTKHVELTVKRGGQDIT